jgi:hypothetical protein
VRETIPLLILASLLWSPQLARGDTFTIRDDTGKTVVIDARLVGERQGSGERPGIIALERADGRIEVVPQPQILKREVGPDPKPISCKTMIERLTEQFGADKFLARAKEPFVVGLVLSEPLPRKYEKRAIKCLEKGVSFMKKVEKGFLDFANYLKLETEESRYPLVVIVFETDDDFIRFHTEETGGRGLSSEFTQGYYNRLTNWLVIRMSECYTFATPLHEAIHQQVYNRGLLQRLARVPVWFDEGIATGFEGEENGERIKNVPKNINMRYARRAMRAKAVDWDDVVSDDKAFRGDVLAGEAYANAWGIHWFLLTKYRKEYLEFLQLLRQKTSLETYDAQTRIQDFERVFGKRVGQLQTEFPAWLEQEAQKQNLSDRDQHPDGYLILHSNLAQVEMTAVKSGAAGELEAAGQMRNVSQIRPMSFHITMETDGGTYAEWYLSNVPPMAVKPLPNQIARKQMKNSPGRASNQFWIKVKSVPFDSDTDKEWQHGQLPVPVWSEH